MNTSFQLYQEDLEGYTPSASIFDMISSSTNELEPKQTKALAYMLASEDKLLDNFLKKLLHYRTAELKGLTFEVMAESYVKSQNADRNKRADIIIRSRDTLHQMQWAVVIEAKSMNIDITSPEELKGQISYYCEKLHEKWKCPIRPVVLTKNIDKSLGSIETVCWSQVIELVEDTKISSRLYDDFKTFIIGANRKMHFYEQEVLAIACGRTYQHVVQNHVYVCPNTKSYHHKKSLFLTFVHDGVMTELFKLKAQYTLPPDPQRIQEMAIPNDDKKVIVRYFTNLRSDRRTANFHTGNDYLTGVVVYVLCGDEDCIQLPEGTKAKKMIRGKAYFKLADMLNSAKCTALVPATQTEA